MGFVDMFFTRKDIDKLVTQENDWDVTHSHTFIMPILTNRYLI